LTVYERAQRAFCAGQLSEAATKDHRRDSNVLYRENGQFKTGYASDQQIFPIRQDRVVIALLLAFAFVGVPLMASEYMFRAILVPFLILSLAAIGLNVLVGYCGQISLGTGAFMAVGAYAAYNFQVRIEGMPLIASLLFGGLCATAIGVVFGIPSLRIKGLYLAVATLAAQFFTDWAFLRIKWFTNNSASGSVAVADLDFFGLPIVTPVQKYLFCLTIVALFALLVKNLVRGHIGREWMAIRDMDVAASVIGIRPVYAKLSAFAVSSFVVGVAGALWGFVYLGSWEPSAFSIDRSFQLLFMIIIGGLGSIMGGFLGAAFIVVLPIALDRMLPTLGDAVGVHVDTATVSHVVLMIYGALIVFFLIVEPHGLARLWSIGKEKLRLWPFPH
jgi:branched-chain amino acid transport system permease protein